VRAESVSGEAGAPPNNEVVEFPTVDPSSAPLPDGHVFYRGQSMLRRVAEQLARIDRQAREMDRFKRGPFERVVIGDTISGRVTWTYR
jgi:hypothetical protein